MTLLRTARPSSRSRDAIILLPRTNHVARVHYLCYIILPHGCIRSLHGGDLLEERRESKCQISGVTLCVEGRAGLNPFNLVAIVAV